MCATVPACHNPFKISHHFHGSTLLSLFDFIICCQSLTVPNLSMKQYRCVSIGQNMVYIEFGTVDSFKHILGVLQDVHVVIRETTVILTTGH